jgi:ABC-type multidrug transport system ATPase subunit
MFGTFGGFVMQDDILSEFMTVKEAFTFTARLRLSHLPEHVQNQRVQ